MRPSPGFTLIELIVTIAVAGILLSLAVPSFRTALLNNQRAAKANELVAALNYARSQAVALRSPVGICRASNGGADVPTCGSGSGWEEGWVVFREITPDNAVTNAAEVLRRQGPLVSAAELARPAAQRLSIRGNGLAGPGVVERIVFGPAGESRNTGTLVVCDQRDFRNGRAIVIANTGRLQSFDTHAGNGSGGPDPRLPSGVTTCQRT